MNNGNQIAQLSQEIQNKKANVKIIKVKVNNENQAVSLSQEIQDKKVKGKIKSAIVSCLRQESEK